MAGRRPVRGFKSWVLCVALSSGCASVPEQAVSVSPLESGAFEVSVQAAQPISGFQTGDWPAQEWWRSFHDEQLDRLMTEALAQNPGMQVAAARVRAAEDAADYAGAATQPTLGLNGSVSRRHFSQNELVSPSFAGTTRNQGRAALEFDYDFDLWGRNKHVLQARLGEAQASKAEQAESRLILSTAVAQAYFRLYSGRSVKLSGSPHLAKVSLTLAGLSDRGWKAPVCEEMVELNRHGKWWRAGTTSRLRKRPGQSHGQGADAAAEIAAPTIHVDKAFLCPKT